MSCREPAWRAGSRTTRCGRDLVGDGAWDPSENAEPLTVAVGWGPAGGDQKMKDGARAPSFGAIPSRAS